jgi:hypothetical protein
MGRWGLQIVAGEKTTVRILPGPSNAGDPVSCFAYPSMVTNLVTNSIIATDHFDH